MSDVEILEAIGEVARVHVGWQGGLEPGMRLVEDLELDSLKSLTLAVEVENRFRICLEPDAEALIVTVGDLVAAVRSCLSDDGGGPGAEARGDAAAELPGSVRGTLR